MDEHKIKVGSGRGCASPTEGDIVVDEDGASGDRDVSEEGIMEESTVRGSWTTSVMERKGEKNTKMNHQWSLR